MKYILFLLILLNTACLGSPLYMGSSAYLETPFRAYHSNGVAYQVSLDPAHQNDEFRPIKSFVCRFNNLSPGDRIYGQPQVAISIRGMNMVVYINGLYVDPGTLMNIGVSKTFNITGVQINDNPQNSTIQIAFYDEGAVVNGTPDSTKISKLLINCSYGGN